MKYMSGLVYEYMSPEERGDVDDFGLWAFGDSLSHFSHGIEFMEAWNKLHGDDFTLSPEGYIEEDILEMVRMWRDAKED